MSKHDANTTADAEQPFQRLIRCFGCGKAVPLEDSIRGGENGTERHFAILAPEEGGPNPVIGSVVLTAAFFNEKPVCRECARMAAMRYVARAEGREDQEAERGGA